MMKRTLLFALTVLIGHSTLQAQTHVDSDPATNRRPRSDNTRGHVLAADARVLRDIEYIPGGGERNRLDLYLPASGTNPAPVIVWVHGGAWLAGSKDECPARRFVSLGYAVASINYRLSQHAIFPAQIEDCKAAIRWLRSRAAEYQFDTNRFAAWGASAGGHLVALLGTTGDTNLFDKGENLDQSSAVQAVVDWFGPTDFTQMSKYSATNSPIDHDAPDAPEAMLIGGPVQRNKDKAAAANPITYVSKTDPPFLIMHGDRDNIVPYQQSELLREALEKAGVSVTLKIIEGAGHGFGGPEVNRVVEGFFDAQLKPKRAK